MQVERGPSFVHVDDGSVDAMDDAVVAFNRAVDVAADQLAAARRTALRHERRVDEQALSILIALAGAETVDDFGDLRERARELLGLVPP